MGWLFTTPTIKVVPAVVLRPIASEGESFPTALSLCSANEFQFTATPSVLLNRRGQLKGKGSSESRCYPHAEEN